MEAQLFFLASFIILLLGAAVWMAIILKRNRW